MVQKLSFFSFNTFTDRITKVSLKHGIILDIDYGRRLTSIFDQCDRKAFQLQKFKAILVPGAS